MNTHDNTSGLFEEEKKNRILLSLDDKQKQALKNGTIGLGGVLLGASVMPLYGFTKDALQDETPDTEAVTHSIETEIPVAYVDDQMSFSDAFAAARKEVGAGGFFEWRGNTYNTYYKEEWEAMSEKEQSDYLASVEKATDVNTVTEYTETTITIEVDEESPVLEPVYGIEDFDEDGLIDAVAIDENHDGYADTIKLDVNGDGYTDGIAYDGDFDGDLDILIIDSGQDGFEDNITVEGIDEVISMDDFIILDKDDTVDEPADIVKIEGTEMIDPDIDHDVSDDLEI